MKYELKFRHEGGLGDLLRNMCIVRNIDKNTPIAIYPFEKGFGKDIPFLFENITLNDYDRIKEKYYANGLRDSFKKSIYMKQDMMEKVDGLENFVFYSFDWSLRTKYDTATDIKPSTRAVNRSRHFNFEEEKEIIQSIKALGYNVVSCDNTDYSLAQVAWLMNNSVLNIVIDSFVGIFSMCVNEETSRKTHVVYKTPETDKHLFYREHSIPFYKNSGANIHYGVNAFNIISLIGLNPSEDNNIPKLFFGVTFPEQKILMDKLGSNGFEAIKFGPDNDAPVEIKEAKIIKNATPPNNPPLSKRQKLKEKRKSILTKQKERRKRRKFVGKKTANTRTFVATETLPETYVDSFLNSAGVVFHGTWGSPAREEKIKNKSITYGNKTIQQGEYALYLAMYNKDLYDLCKKHNLPVISTESPTLSRVIANYNRKYNANNHTAYSYMRLSLEHWTYGKGHFLDASDITPEKLPIDVRLYNHHWSSNPDGSIYILCGLEVDPTSTIPVYDFITTSIERIRKVSSRKIKVKLHPLSKGINYSKIAKKYKNVEFVSKSIQDMYHDMFAAVIDNSTSIFELIDAGIPTFCSSSNFGRDLGNLLDDLENIETPYLATPEEVLKWTNDMACTEFPIHKFRSGSIVKEIDILLNKYEHLYKPK